MIEVYIMLLNIGISVFKNNYRYFIDFCFLLLFFIICKIKRIGY